MKKIKVLHRAATTGAGGVEKYVINNYRYLDRDKYQFDFITRNPALGEMKEIQELNIGVKTFTATENTNKELLIQEINEILDEGYDVIHMNTSCWAGFLIEELAMQRNVPKVIVHSHSTGVDQISPEKLKYQLERHEYFKNRFSKSYATDLCACSKLAADWLFGPHIPREEIKYLKNAIEVDKYSFNQSVRNEVRNSLGIDGCFVVGHIGRFSYQKNHPFLIDVFHNVYKKNPKARLVLIGQGEYGDDVKKQVQEYGLQNVVLFLGWRQDIEQLLQGMDVFVLPSRFEGLPFVLVEAQASGVKCVASDFITSEVGITDNIEFIPLYMDSWVNKLLNYANGYERKNMDKVITDVGYNIKYASKELELLHTGGGV